MLYLYLRKVNYESFYKNGRLIKSERKVEKIKYIAVNFVK